MKTHGQFAISDDSTLDFSSSLDIADRFLAELPQIHQPSKSAAFDALAVSGFGPLAAPIDSPAANWAPVRDPDIVVTMPLQPAGDHGTVQNLAVTPLSLGAPAPATLPFDQIPGLPPDVAALFEDIRSMVLEVLESGAIWPPTIIGVMQDVREILEEAIEGGFQWGPFAASNSSWSHSTDIAKGLAPTDPVNRDILGFNTDPHQIDASSSAVGDWWIV